MSTEEFTGFIEELTAITPALGDTLAGNDEPRLPDMDTPVLWMSSVGHALAVVLPGLTSTSQHALFAVVERGMSSGSELLRTTVATGLLEALTHDMDRAVVARSLVLPLLGVQSRAYLDAWDTYTRGDHASGTP